MTPPSFSTSPEGRVVYLAPKVGAFLPLIPCPLYSFPPLPSPAPFPVLPSLPSFPLLVPSPMQLGGLGSAVSSPSGVRGKAPAANVFAAILSPENVSGGSDFCFVLWRKKCADLLKLSLCYVAAQE